MSSERQQINSNAGIHHTLSRQILGIDWYDTESSARRVIEWLAEGQEPVGYVVEKRTCSLTALSGVIIASAILEDFVTDGTPLYAAPVSEAKAQGVVMPEPDFWLDNGATPCYYAEPLRAALNAAPVQQDQAFCEYCGGNDEEPQDHCMDCTRPVQQASVPASAFASRAITHYEAALLAAFPSGSSGEVFNQWNEARRILAAAPAVPSQGEQVRVVPVEPTEAMRKAAQDKLASEGLIVTDWLIHTAYSAMLAAAPAAPAADAPPENCRQRLAAEGKPYPRSSCAACGKFSPKWRECDAALAAHRAKGVV